MDSGFKIRNFKFYFAFLTFTFFVFNFSYAAPCYGTGLPKKNHFVLGLQEYSIYKRDLKDDFGKVSSRQYFLLLSYGVFDWLSIDLKGGTGNIKQHLSSSEDIDYGRSFAGGYGFRLKFLDKNNAKMVFGFQHISVHPFSAEVSGIKHKAILDDWQFSLLCSYDFKRFTPYIGSRWSRIDYIHWNNGSRKRIMSDLNRSTGLIAGIDIPFNKKLWLNVEGQFFDSTGLCASLNYSF
jgi:hypothetical protein